MTDLIIYDEVSCMSEQQWQKLKELRMTWKPDLCIYHGNCDDGFAAALVARQKWPDLPCFGAMHNQPLPVSVAGKNVLMVDFSLKRDVMVQQLWASCIVLDHHKTAEADLAGFINPILDAGPDRLGSMTGINARFDLGQSGAGLTYRWLFPELITPRFIRLIEARDLWMLSEEVQQFSAAVRSYPMHFDIWQRWLDDDLAVQELILEGKGILRAHNMTIAKILREKHVIDILGNEVMAVNCPYHFASDAAHLLLEGDRHTPFGAAYFRRADGRWQFSLRSDDTRRDVSEIAKAFGGGGHRNAAGFDVEYLSDLENGLLATSSMAR